MKSDTDSRSSLPQQNAPTSAPIQSADIDWWGTAYAMQGAVVTKSEGSSMAYYRKCEACGHVDSTSHIQTNSPRKGERFETSFTCQKCGNNQKLQIGAS